MFCKILSIFAFLLIATVAASQTDFVGSWKEDQYKRQNLNDYLYYRGLNWFKRVYVTNANFELTMNVARSGNSFSINGVKGPKLEAYSFELMADNVTRTDADLGALGGPRLATAEISGNSLITYLHKPEDDVVDVVAIRTIEPDSPDVMIYTLRDVASGTELISYMEKQ